ncbi:MULTISPECIES: amino acid deaminase/aldolase [unclassified Burkholderia]|uniref:amino acid deaminase/aldolase n=2 Tax=Burkholderia TaxID=32008 RepID=UPI0014227E8A|nr:MULTISPECIES: amino acid deaminase/aldolase [unclassified Burkholderia]NIE85533.1 amino acid deaminase/aldolase [Burkholderia sp. Tr-860]NIF98081.1 amino acid deaminase/aldolase [Burkholderia sp. Ax-1720]
MSRADLPPRTHAALPDYPTYREALMGQRLPAAFVDLDQFDANLADLKRRARGLPIRLATKSLRSRELIAAALAGGPFMQGLLCYSAAEAAWLADSGFDDIVVAYPGVEPDDLRAVAVQSRRGRSITLMVDAAAQVDAIARIARDEAVTIPLAIDLDMSSAYPGLHFGMYRSPVRDVAAALALANHIGDQEQVRLAGLMGYEGQIAGLADMTPGGGARNALIRVLKRRSAREVNARRQAVVRALAEAGHALRFVNGGGTGSFESTLDDPSVTELAAGSGLYAPALFDHYAAFHARPAAGFALPVTRIPRPGMATCSGGGYIASGPAGPSRLPSPWLPAGCTLVRNEGAGEVQTPLRLPRGFRPAIGDPVLFRHAKAGELCERFNSLLLIRDGRVIGETPTYRGDGKSFF